MPDISNPDQIKENKVTIRSADGASFQITVDACQHAGFLKDAMGGDDDDDDENALTVPADGIEVPRVNEEPLKYVVHFLEHFKTEPLHEIPVPLDGRTFDEVIKQEFYREFINERNMSSETLHKVLTAANFMNIQPLLDLACVRVTFDLQGKTAEEIREILNLPNMTEEEEARAREEHPWIFDEEEDNIV